MNPNELIDPLAARAWLEGKSVGLFKKDHPLRDEVSGRLMEHLHGMVLQPKDILVWRALSSGHLAMAQLRDRFAQARLHFWQELPMGQEEVQSSFASSAWWSGLKALMPWSAASRPEPFELHSEDAVDMVFSSLALHNEPNPMEVISAWARFLRPQGLAIFSCWGPDTLKELRAVYAQLGWPEPMHPLVDMHNWGDLLVQNGLSDPVMDMEYLTLTYDRVEVLVSDLRFLGRNLNPKRSHGLRSGKWPRQLLGALEEERIRLGGRLSLTFEIIYGHAFKGMPQLKMQRETQVSLGEMRKQLKSKR